MGIRGLTTFINSNCKLYLEEYHLHDTYLVIDGYNIASHLYKWHCKRNDCFGGDYDKYARVVREFFKLLDTCKVIPLIVYDGGYENKKLKTVYHRLSGKIRLASNLNSVTQGSVTMFPLFLRDLFVDIVASLGLKAVQCDGEADYEISCIAKSLCCPVLSYDSDFYIFDVLYIPFSSFQMSFSKGIKNNVPCKFTRCQIYRIEKFLKLVGGLHKENLPLLATLLGNDYIKQSVFHQFYEHLKLPKTKPGLSTQQTRILGVSKWLKNETYNTAVHKILSRIKLADRTLVAEQIKVSTETYLNYNSKMLQYLGLEALHEDVNTGKCYNINPEELAEDLSNESTDHVSDDSEGSIAECDVETTPPLNNIIPDWFTEKVRQCKYPQAFINILYHNLYISTPQLEDYSNACSHTISFPILAVIQKLILPVGATPLTCAVRTNCSNRVSNIKVARCRKNIPTLSEIFLLTAKPVQSILVNALDITINDDLLEIFNVLPSTWHLYIISIIYWIKNAAPQVIHSHILSIILCFFVLQKVDNEIGFYRATSKFRAQFSKEINTSTSNFKNTPKDSNIGFQESYNSISYEECLLFMNELIEYFQMNEKMRYYAKLFDIRVLDCFAQFQSCALHIKYLNVLLNTPFNNFVISDCYDGTFLFNMHINLSKRTNVNAYLQQTLFRFSPNIFNCIMTISQMILKLIPINCIYVPLNNRRRRKKKKVVSNSENEQDCVADVSDSEQNTELDVNNRFSTLSLLN